MHLHIFFYKYNKTFFFTIRSINKVEEPFSHETLILCPHIYQFSCRTGKLNLFYCFSIVECLFFEILSTKYIGALRKIIINFIKAGYDMENVKESGTKQVHCPHCKYSTDRKNNMKRHIVTMHQDSSKLLECCDIVFKSKALLREHVNVYHRSGYSCSICNRNFCRKALLRRHLSVHNGQKDFHCSSCSYATSHKSNLERHQRIHARRNSASESTEEKEFSDSESATSRNTNTIPKQQRHNQFVKSKTHTKIVAKYENMVNRNELFSKDTSRTKEHTKEQSFVKTEAHDDNMNKVNIEGVKQETERVHTSAKRLVSRPYKCSLCNHCFTCQKQQQVHSCTYIQENIPNVPITCLISKGIPPEEKYHL